MSNTKRTIVCALFSFAVLCAAAAAHAQSPFDGTWRVDLAQTKFSPKPLTFYTSQGWYHCTGSCNPSYDVAADGQDHAVAGHSYVPEAFVVLCRFAFEDLALHRLQASIIPRKEIVKYDKSHLQFSVTFWFLFYWFRLFTM